MTEEIFKKELEKIGIKITDKQIEQLNEYQKLLKEWNEFMNLTGITEKEEVYLKHYYDSLTINKVIDIKELEGTCADVIYTVYDKDFIKENRIDVDCYKGIRCLSCKKCYRQYDTPRLISAVVR